MVCRKLVFVLLILCCLWAKSRTAYAQAPSIKYPGPQVYVLDQTIFALAPQNTGGNVPYTAYGQVTAFAGSGLSGAANGRGAAASFNNPRRLVADNAGNIYVADLGNNLVRKITADGTVSTVNIRGLNFSGIDGITMDAGGNIYLTDESRNSIDKITPLGAISVVAGSGSYGNANGRGSLATFNYPIGIATDKAGNIYVADYQNQLIRKIDPTYNVTTLAGKGQIGAVNGPGADATFSYPNGVGVDGVGNVFVADGSNKMIRKITPTGEVSTFAGAATGSFGDPQHLAIDALNNIYVTDALKNQVIKVTPAGQVTVLAGSGIKAATDGLGTAAAFNGPVGITIGSDGSLYVADSFNNLIRQISIFGYAIDKPLPAGLVFDPKTGIISGTPTALSSSANYTVTAYNAWGSSSAVVNITVNKSSPAGTKMQLPPNISYSSPQNYTVNTAITPLAPKNTGDPVPPNIYGQVVTIAGTGSAGYVNGTGRSASISAPLGLGCDANGDVFVGDYNNNLIREITPALAVSTYSGVIGGHGAQDGLRTRATFTLPQGVAMDKNGNLYIADSYDQLIRKITPTGTVTTIAGQNGVRGSNDGKNATFDTPTGVAADNLGNVFVADQGNELIREITPDGTVSTFAGSPGITGSQNGPHATFNQPTGITFDNSGNLFVADAGNNLIRMITPAGNVSTFAGSGTAGSVDGQALVASFNNPTGITADYAGVKYVADEHNNLVRKIMPDGTVSTLAGSGVPGLADGTFKGATFSYPESVAADQFGNVYVGDVSTFLIRRITVTGYTIDKALPPGLTFDPTTGIITGTPTGPWPPTDYTITAYNSLGSSSAVVNIGVGNSAASGSNPPNISYQTPQTYVVGTPIKPLAANNSGGAVPARAYGLVSTYAGASGGGNVNGPANTALFSGPIGLAFDGSGNLFVSENKNNDIRKITPGGIVSNFAGNGRAALANGPAGTASFDSPGQLAFDNAGNLYVTDEQNNLIRKITSAGLVSSYAGSGAQGSANGSLTTATLNDPLGLAIDPTGIMYIADKGNSTVRKVDLSGQVTTFSVFNGGSGPSGNGSGALFNITTDAAGNVYYEANNQTGSISPAGSVTTIAGGNPGFADGAGTAASFFRPDGIARSASGFIYVADGFNNRIRSISPTGNVTTVAGEFGSGYSDGIGSAAAFSNPAGLTLDASGNFLFVADYSNNLIRKISVTGYTIDKSLPNGLVFDSSTGTISGTPTIATPAQNYTITAYNTAGSSSATISIETITEQTVFFDPIPPKTVCDADFDPGATGSGPITYTSSDATIATIVNGKIHLTGPGTATITASDGVSQAQQKLTVSGSVTPTISITPAPADTCEGKIMVYAAQITGGGTKPVLQWKINGLSVGPNSQEFSTTNLNAGDQVTCTLISNATCATANSVTSNISVFSIDPPVSTSVKITASDTGLICRGTQVTFTAVAYTPDVHPVYQWQVNGINAGLNQATFTSDSFNDGDQITCLVTSAGKCIIDPQTSSNALTVKFSPKDLCTIVIPNTFTPNGDGVNDLWHITALAAYPGCSVSVYNRSGTLIFNSISYSTPWDGTMNGQKLPVGTYYYVIDLRNGRKPLSGSVTLLR